MAIKDGLILAVGSSDDIAEHIGDTTEVIDLEGKLAVPGFIEGHGHFESLGNSKMILDLTTVNNWNEIVTMVGDAVENAEPGAWIQGRGWHQEKWDALPPGAIDGMPDHAGLSEVSPNNPLFLEHASGHAAFANAAAMELAGIDRNTPDPPGSTIVKGADGEPTGALRETAQKLTENILNEYLDSRTLEERRADDENGLKHSGGRTASAALTAARSDTAPSRTGSQCRTAVRIVGGTSASAKGWSCSPAS